MRVLLTWFPRVEWMKQPWLTLRQARTSLPSLPTALATCFSMHPEGPPLLSCRALSVFCLSPLPPFLREQQVTDPYLNLFRNLIPPLMGQARARAPSAPSLTVEPTTGSQRPCTNAK